MAALTGTTGTPDLRSKLVLLNSHFKLLKQSAAPQRPNRWRIVSLSALACAVLSTSLATPAADPPGALATLERAGARITAEVYDLDNNAVIQQLNADQRLAPASVTKLVIAGAALETWAADRTFQTKVFGTGEFREGKVGGDLVLQGAGDPTFENASLWVLASQIRGAGVTEVKGRVLVVPAPFGPVACETKDRCDAMRRSSTAYNALLSSVGVDYGNWCVDVRPTTPGADAVVGGCSVTKLPVPIQGTIRTVSAKEKPNFWIDRSTSDDGEVLKVGGDIPVGEGQRVYRAMSDPALDVGLLLRQTLREAGITVNGPVQIEPRGLPAGAFPLAQSEGLSLKEQLGRMLRFSNNYIADVLTLDLAAEIGHGKTDQLASAGQTLSEYIGRLISTGNRNRTPPNLYSGSGLTPENELSASDLIALLSHQYHNTRTFPTFYGGLVVPRQAPFAFIRQGDSNWLDRVTLKTGTMDDPYSVCGIAGYMRKKDGGWMAFAILVNGGPEQRHVPLYKAMEAARGDLEAILARY